MPKRKEVDSIAVSSKRRATDGDEQDENESDEDSDTELLNVEFEWFDPQEIDFQGLKVLLRQLFDVDNILFNLSALASLILAQPLLGSTVKVSADDDDNDEVETHQTDPYAFLTVLNLTMHADKPEIQAVRAYLSSKSQQQPPIPTTATPGLRTLLPDILANPACQVGLVLTERFINMPLEIVPPMYNMLLEEIEWALDAKEPYNFTHYLLITKVYAEVASTLDLMDRDDNDDQAAASNGRDGRRLDGKAKAEDSADPAGGSSEIEYFHPEDQALKRHALAHGIFTYTHESTSSSDAKRAFQDAGIRPFGGLILIEASRFKDAVRSVGEFAASRGE